MNGSPSAIITLGLGALGSVNLLMTMGFGVGEEDHALTGPPWNPIHFQSDNRRLEHRSPGNRIEYRSPNRTIQLNKKS